MGHTLSARIFGLSCVFAVVAGCDSVDLQEIVLEPTVTRSFAMVQSDYEKTWTCSVPPVGLCELGGVPTAQDKPSKTGFNVGYNFKNEKTYVYASCNCYVNQHYAALHRGAVFFDLLQLKPKVFFSAKITFQDGNGYKTAGGTAVSNDNDGSFRSVVAGATNWFSTPNDPPGQNLQVVSAFPATGDTLFDGVWSKPFAQDANKDGMIAHKGAAYSLNITKTAQQWRDNATTNKGVMFLPQFEALPGDTPTVSSANMGSFWNVKLRITYNAKLKANMPTPFPGS
jgi:hypothetical protein